MDSITLDVGEAPLMPEPSQPLPGPPGPNFGPLPRADLLSLLRADQRHRWRNGERIAAEAYVDRLPFLGDDNDALLDLVVGEVELRAELGEPCDLEQYRRRFPQLAGPIIWRLALHRSAVGSVLPSGNHLPTLPAPPAPAEPMPALPEPGEPEPTDLIPLTRPAVNSPAPVEAPVATTEASAATRLWQWCRRHPAPATLLTSVAACAVFGAVASQFAGRAASTTPPADVRAGENVDLRLARERADRAERDAAAERDRAIAARAAADDATRAKEAAEIRAARLDARSAEDQQLLESLFADVTNVTQDSVRARLLAAARTHYEAVVKEQPTGREQQLPRARAQLRLGLIADAQGEPDTAIARFRQAVDALAPLAAGRADFATANDQLGRVLRGAGQLAEAEAAGRRAVATWDANPGAADDDVVRGRARSLAGLADTLVSAKKYDEAIELYRRTIDIWSHVKPDGRDLATTFDRLADCLFAAGQAEPAARARQRAVATFRSLAEKAPADSSVIELLAHALTSLAQATTDPATAVPQWEEAIAAWDRLASRRPADLKPRADTIAALDRLAEVQRRAGQADAAERTAERALTAREQLVAAHPGVSEHESALAAAYTDRGERLRDRRRDDAAAAEFRRAAPLLESLVRRSPDDRDLVLRLTHNEMCLAQLDLRSGQIEAARAGFIQALGRLEELTETEDVAVNRAVCCVNLGQLAVMGREAKEAKDWYDRAEQLLKPLAEHPAWKAFVSAALADCARGREKVRPR